MLAKSSKVSASSLKQLNPVEQKRSEFFNIKFFPGDKKAAKFSCIVSKKISPLAVRRNFLKRVIFEFFRKEKDKLNPDFIYLVVALPKCAKIIDSKDAIVEQLKKVIYGRAI